MSALEADASSVPKTSVNELFKSYIILTKPRINALLLFTALAAAIVANDGFPSPLTCLVLIVGLGLSAAGAASINMWYDRDIDAIMGRTKDRPLPQGVLPAQHALIFGIALETLSLIVFLSFSNPLSAALSFAGFLYYAVIYTMCLKRRTPQNIVIGGGAGAFPPLIGWAVITGSVSMAAMLMFLVIFFWTPSHFWSLALYKNEDYKRAKVPMMPVVKGARVTKVQCLIYSAILAVVAIVLAFTEPFNAIYLVLASVISVGFFIVNIMLWKESDHQLAWAKRTFIASLIHLPAIFIAMVLSVLL